MPTVVFNAYSVAFPSITNRIKASISKESSPLAIVASIIDTTSGHPARIWSFPGLPRDNYRFSLDEIDGGGSVVANIAVFSAVPSEVDGELVRDDEQIKCDTTTGFTSGTNTFTFDGTGGKPDYRGWEIVPSEISGRGILIEGLDYSWDKDTAVFLLLQAGDVFPTNVYYNIHFNPISNPVGNSVPSVKDFEINLITANTTLTDDYFGKKLIIEPASVYIEVTLPDISTVVEGRPLMVEIGNGSISCTKFKSVGGTVINWLRGAIYALPNESLSIYKYVRSGTPEWRVCDADGNFKTCGQSVADDSGTVFNKYLMNGDIVLKTQFARIYNEIVLNLPISQVVDFDSWATGNNKYFFSLANSSNPTYANKFHFPDRRDIYYRNTKAGTKAGDFLDHMMLEHQHIGTMGESPSPLFGKTIVNYTHGNYSGSSNSKVDLASKPCSNNGTLLTNVGTETRPVSVLINQYILI